MKLLMVVLPFLVDLGGGDGSKDTAGRHYCVLAFG